MQFFTRRRRSDEKHDTAMRLNRIIITLFAAATTAAATMQAAPPRRPLYIVNGHQVDDLRDIAPEDIVSTDMLPADEQTVEQYGDQASNGVIIVSLRYDTPAMFGDGGESFADYVARNTDWGQDERVARFVVRFTVNPDGSISLGDELESTDARMRRKVLRTVAAAPAWTPAMKDGQPVASSHVLRIQLPEGRQMPPEPAIILR